MAADDVFVGRRDELRTIEAAWATRAGTGHVVLVSAAPGYGKTALVEQAVRRIGDGVSVLRASPLQVEADTSWSTLRMLSAAWPVEELPPPVAVAVGRAPAGAEPPVLADVAFAFAEALRAGDRDTLVVIDDVQWIDRASAAAVATAMRSAPVFWLLGARSGHDSHLDVTRVVDADHLTHVPLAPMRRGEIGELVTRHFGGPWPVPTIGYLAATSEGQPLHAIELARELRGGDGRAGPPPAGRTLAAVYGDRLDALPPQQRDIAALAALAVHPTIRMLMSLRPDTDVEGALAALERGGLLRVGLDAVDFAHALARRAVTERLGTLERARLHRELADHVGDPERRALHLGEGTTVPDAAVAAELEAAARSAAARGATFDAARLAERAAELTPEDDPGGAALRTALAGVAYADAGDHRRARGLLAPIVDARRDRLDTALASEVTITWLGIVARLEGNAAAASVVPPLIDGIEDPATRGHLRRTLVRLLQFDDLRAAEQAALDAVADADEHGDDVTQLAADAALANVRFLRGERVDLDALLARLDAIGEPGAGGQSATAFIQELASWDDRHGVARRLCERLAEHGRATGQITSYINALNQLATVEMHAGDLASCRKLVDELLDIVAPPRGAPMFDVSEEVIRLPALAGDDAEAIAIVRDVETQVDDIPTIMRLSFWGAAATAAITAGRYDDALPHLERAWTLAGEIGYADVRSVGFQPDLAETLVHVGRLDRAEEVVAFLADAAERSGSELVRVEHLRCAGLLAAAQGLTGEAVAMLERAAATAAHVGRPLTAGRTVLALGVALRRSGSRTAARERLQEARRVFAELDAPPWVERADRELGRLGTRTAATATLSPTERRIAELVTLGRSNREIATELIVSVRTVESNLTRAYRKLGVRGRTELAARGATLLEDGGRGDG